MLPCVCSVIDHEADVADVLTTFCRLLWSTCILLNRRTATWNLFALYDNEVFIIIIIIIIIIISKIFQHNAKAGICPAFALPLPCLCPTFAHFDEDEKSHLT